MRQTPCRILTATAFVVAVAASTADAQTTYPNIKVSGRLQQQFYFFDNDPYAATVGPQSNFFIRRARIEARGQIAENVSVYIQPSFEGGRPLTATTTCTSSPVPAGGGTPTVTCRTTGRSGLRLRDAYMDVRFGKESDKTVLYLRGGQEKRPVSRYELISSTNLPSIERGAGQGLLARASNDLFTGAGFLSHDVGASLRLEHKLDDVRLVTVKVGAYNGQGESLNDVNDAKSFGARATAGITPKLDVGASWFAHDGIVTVNGAPDSSFTNYAFDLDASWGKPGDEGLFALAEYLHGNDATANKFEMQGFQALAAYNVRMKSPTAWLYAIEPSLRVDFADPNTDADDDRVTTITAGFGVYMSSRAWLRLAYERQSFQAEDTESISGVRSMLAVSF
ncbi:MAG TPA: porin [Gemmatimonadales bacterium]|nr:porin [Gemmatimonadales bacterium]